MDSDRFFVKSLTLENFRCFEKVELGPFDPHFNLLVGANGTGKSSALLALALLFRQLALNRAFDIHERVTTSDFRLASARSAIEMSRGIQTRWRFRSLLDWGLDLLEIEEEFGPSALPTYSGRLHRIEEGGIRVPKGPEGLNQFEYRDRFELICLYSVRRQFANVSADSSPDLNQGKASAYINWSDAGQASSALRDWMRDQTLAALQAEQRARNARDGLAAVRATRQLALVQGAIVESVEGATKIEYDAELRDIVVEFLHQSVQQFSSMSDGQRALIGLVADLARRACLLNAEKFGAETLERTTGIVLIDELDLHLHPKWQRRVISDLKRIFPKIQFFATTHSPQIIGEARPEEIVLLTPQGQKRPMASYGMDSNWVLECVMEAEGRDPAIARRIKDLFDAIDDDRIEEARGMIASLRADIGPAPDLIGAESYIWRIEHEGDEAAE